MNASADGGGFVSDSSAAAKLNVSGPTQAVIGQTADVYANALSMFAHYDHMTVDVKSEATSGGLFGGASASNSGTVNPDTEVMLQGSGTTAVAVEGTDMRALVENVNVSQSSSGTCFCIGPSDGNNNNISFSMDAKVTASSGAKLTTGPRVFPGPGVPAEDETPLQNPGGFSHLALFAAADSPSGTKEIHWESDLLLLSGPIPRLQVNSAGHIVRAINVTINGGQNAVGSDAGSNFSVDDIVNDDPGQVLFKAPSITGTGSTWDFRDTFDRVVILNEAATNMTINNIDVVNRTAAPFVDLQSSGAPGLRFGIVHSVAPTLVTIDNTADPTVFVNGTIENPIGTTSIVVADGDVRSTHPRDVSDGAGHVSLIRTNVLDIETPLGGVGQLSSRINVDVVDGGSLPQGTTFRTTRASGADDTIFLGRHQFFTGELVLYQTAGTAIGGLTSGHYYKVIVTSDGEGIQLAEVGTPGTAINLDPSASSATTAHTLTPVQRFTVLSPNDIWLDVKGRLRDPSVTPASSYHVIIDAIVSAQNVDILLQASVNETGGSGTYGGILVKFPGSSPASGQTFLSNFNSGGAAQPRDIGVFGDLTRNGDREHLRLPRTRSSWE